MKDVATSVCMFAAVGVTGTASVYKLIGLRSQRHAPETRTVIVALAALAGASLFYTPVFYRFFDEQVTGIDNLSELIGHAFVLCAAWQAQCLLLYLTRGSEAPSAIRWRGLVLLVALVAMTAFFVADHVHPDTTRFTVMISAATPIACYWITLVACLWFELGDAARLSWQCARLAPGEWLGLGLTITATGCVIGIIAFAIPLDYVLLRFIGDRPPLVLDTLGRCASIISMVLVSAGSTMPAWGKSLASTPHSALRAYRSHRRLRHLWNKLQSAVPDIALHEPSHDLEFRLYRRVIEIRDGILTLTPGVDPAVRDIAVAKASARGLVGTERDAVVQATVIRAALDNTAAQSVEPSMPEETVGGDDLDAEVAWLERVALAYRELPAEMAS